MRQKKVVLQGYLNLRSYSKNVAYGNKKKYFSCTYTFFVVPLCVINK